MQILELGKDEFWSLGKNSLGASFFHVTPWSECQRPTPQKNENFQFLNKLHNTWKPTFFSYMALEFLKLEFYIKLEFQKSGTSLNILKTVVVC